MLKGGSYTEVVSATTLANDTGNTISKDVGGSGSKITLGTLTAPGSGAMYTLAISEANLATTTTANHASGILALGRVTVGSHFGANDGTVNNNIVDYSGYTPVTTAGGGSATVVNQLTGGGTMTVSLTNYALRIVNDGGSNVLALNTGVDITLSNNSTLLYAGGGSNEYTINGSLTSEVRSASGNQPFVINTASGTTLTINTALSTSGGKFNKAGTGTLVLGGNAVHTGTNYVQQGVLRLTNAAGAGDTNTGGIVVQGGAALQLSNGITVGTKALTINGVGISNDGALRNYGGSNIYGGAITIGASGARINADDTTSLELKGGITTTVAQDVTFGGAGNTTVSTAAISGGGNVIKDGAGTLTLSATNTYTGATTVSQGKLVLANNSAAGSGGLVSLSGATEADLQINSGITIANNITFSNSNANSSVIRQVAANTGANTTDDYTTGTSGTLKSSFDGGKPDTTAAILGGTNSGAATDLVMSFSASSNATNESARRSDIFKISGTTGTDNYVVQLKVSGLASDSRLAFWDGNSSNPWVIAGNGVNFFADAYNSGLHFTTGYYGFDINTGSAWAVVNGSFSGGFTVIPEPGTALGGLLLTAGLLRRRRKDEGRDEKKTGENPVERGCALNVQHRRSLTPDS